MADILIRGMEMPERCDAKCPLYNTGSGYFDCVVTKQYYNWGLPGRPSDCPLVELPDHGDLIDRDVLPQDRVEWDDVVNAPVVILSNKEKTK